MPAAGGFHLLGAGGVGCLFAHHLQRAGVPITLILRSPQRQQFVAQGCRIAVETPADQPATASTSQPTAELMHHEYSSQPTSGPIRYHRHDNFDNASSPIARLLVTTKANQTLAAVAAIRHRLHSDSVVVLLQNGVLAVHEQLLTELFPDAPTRPAFILGSTTHGVYRRDPFHVVHAGVGSCLFGQLPHEPFGRPADASSSGMFSQPQLSQQQSDEQQEQRVQHEHAPSRHQQQQQLVADALSLLACPTQLHPNVNVRPEELQHQLLLKLVVNCCINPLAALLRCCNGGLLDNPYVASAWAGIIQECKAIFGDAALPYTAAELEMHVRQVAAATSGNINSMLQDVMAGNPTEVHFLNGYVTKHAAARSVAVPWNLALVALMHVQEAFKGDMVLPH